MVADEGARIEGMWTLGAAGDLDKASMAIVSDTR